MAGFREQRRAFRSLHQAGCFVMPNPWDAGSAVYLRKLGFKALATTSAGFGFSRGLPDDPRVLSRDLVLQHVADIVNAAGELPVNADFQSGYAQTPDGVYESVRLCIATGAAGLSIEDATGDPVRPLYERSEAVDRLVAARRSIDSSGADVLLTARAECFLVGHSDPLRESIHRLQSYAAAGADVLFAPGVKDRGEILAIVEAVRPKPVNVLMSASTGLCVSDLAEIGVRRISVGSALARTAWAGFIHSAKQILQQGRFDCLGGAASFDELNAFFG